MESIELTHENYDLLRVGDIVKCTGFDSKPVEYIGLVTKSGVHLNRQGFYAYWFDDNEVQIWGNLPKNKIEQEVYTWNIYLLRASDEVR